MVFFLGLSVACQSGNKIPSDTIVIGIDKFPENFDPRLPTDSISQKINKLIYSGLLKLDQNLQLVGDLAKDFEMKDAQTYVFHLHEGILFHNGQKLTSSDVKATYKSMMDVTLKSPFQASLSIIESIETPDDLTVIFKLKKPNSPFLTLMSLGILPKNPQKKMPGTGPYFLNTKSNSRDVVLLERFDAYFGPKAKTRNLVFRVIQDSTLRVLELIKGRIDLVQNDIPYVLISRLQQEQDIGFLHSAGINFAYMAFNFKNQNLSDRRVREAITLAIDRERIIKYKLAGMAIPANSLMSPEHWAHDETLPQFQQDLAKAKKLLDETDFKDPDGDGPQMRFRLVYKTSSVKERIEIAQLIAENLAQISIGVDVKPYEFGTFYRDIRQGNFDIFTLAWVGLTDPDIYYSVFHSQQMPPNGANRGFYKNPELDTLLEKSRIATDQSELKNIYQQIQKIVYNDFVYAPLWYENNFAFVNKNVKGYQLRANASYVGLTEASKE